MPNRNTCELFCVEKIFFLKLQRQNHIEEELTCKVADRSSFTIPKPVKRTVFACVINKRNCFC